MKEVNKIYHQFDWYFKWENDSGSSKLSIKGNLLDDLFIILLTIGAVKLIIYLINI